MERMHQTVLTQLKTGSAQPSRTARQNQATFYLRMKSTSYSKPSIYKQSLPATLPPLLPTHTHIRRTIMATPADTDRVFGGNMRRNTSKSRVYGSEKARLRTWGGRTPCVFPEKARQAAVKIPVTVAKSSRAKDRQHD